jgi:hypothetical protein
MLFLLEKPCGNLALSLYNYHIRDFSVNCFILADYVSRKEGYVVYFINMTGIIYFGSTARNPDCMHEELTFSYEQFFLQYLS